ncbi:MAG: hypothetical protein JSS86_01915 [Cyanobacteria bacterium SZAS LIN-2]|nr:hypothetical protein [Cyanobacteria bacterium SZAS LIN-3]MBS1995031.1 hypothetical protein [Cyanobacteria bacterium SZAS LIN-2]MBS2010077.1 hypothetical protein [Cyanobacteria bacterium SZAS TMP-1]
MKFHSDLFGWEYVWRNFADAKGGTINTESAAEDSPLVSMTISVPLGETGKTATLLIAPASQHGKKSTGIKVVAPFEPVDDFVFCIFPENLGHQISKAVGMQDIKVMDQLFDSKFIIQGNHPARVCDLFDNVNLRELVLLQPPSRLSIETKSVKGEDKKAAPSKYHAVSYQHDGVVDKLHQLETAIEIVASVLQHVLSPYEEQTARPVAVEEEIDGATTQGKRLRSPLLDR